MPFTDLAQLHARQDWGRVCLLTSKWHNLSSGPTHRMHKRFINVTLKYARRTEDELSTSTKTHRTRMEFGSRQKSIVRNMAETGAQVWRCCLLETKYQKVHCFSSLDWCYCFVLWLHQNWINCHSFWERTPEWMFGLGLLALSMSRPIWFTLYADLKKQWMWYIRQSETYSYLLWSP